MKVVTQEIFISPLQQDILCALLYFDIFNYPLRSGEVFRFLRTNSDDERIVEHNLQLLSQQQLIFSFGEFYTLQNNPDLMNRRIRGNKLAATRIPLAQKQAKLIAAFPFVRAVMASGSLSKDFMDEKSDLDFFIVTEPGKLWMARTMLVMFKRLFLFNSHKNFCINYFVDEHHLRIEEQNLFTATELATVMPLYNWQIYFDLQTQNIQWLKGYFPNYQPRKPLTVINVKTWFGKPLLEKLLSIFGNSLELLFMKLTLKRWNRIYKDKYGDADFKVAFKTNGHTSKNHPRNYQKTVIERYKQKVDDFSVKHDIGLHA
jgi:hypothetical protein